MKKILLCAALLSLMVTSCKKKENDPSKVVTVSFPVITLKSNYFVISVGNSLPSPSAVGSAKDTFYNTSVNLLLVDSTVNFLVPGVYQATASAQSKNGFISYQTYFVVVTSFRSGEVPNLAGNYYLAPSGFNNTTVTADSSVFYTMSNFNAANTTTGSLVSANFAVITDSTFAFTDANLGFTGAFSLATGDTTITYAPSGTPITYTKF